MPNPKEVTFQNQVTRTRLENLHRRFSEPDETFTLAGLVDFMEAYYEHFGEYPSLDNPLPSPKPTNGELEGGH